MSNLKSDSNVSFGGESIDDVHEIRDLRIMENESKYEGEWDRKRNCIDGRGVQIWNDGTRYEGMWVDGKQHGYGRIVYPEGESYVGDWRNNQIEGQGTYTYYNGTICDGCWKGGV